MEVSELRDFPGGRRRAPMMARISREDTVLYANRALADYLGVEKRDLAGVSVEFLAARCRGEIAGCFRREDGGRRVHRLVCDEDGRVFEVRASSEAGVLDIVLDEVSPGGCGAGVLEGLTGTPVREFTEEELRTARQPERRYLTLSVTRLRDVPSLAGKLPPMDLRVMLDAFLEEAGESVLETGCTLGASSGQTLMGIYGAPRLFSDHPLRAVKAACETLRRAAVLHAGFAGQGKEMPPCSIGIWTGEALVGVFGAGASRKYTALGAPSELASRLSLLSRPGEILLPEHTLTHLLRVLPEGWTHLRAESENEPDLSDFQWSGEEVLPVPSHLRKVVYLVGPGVEEDPGRAEFFFDYLWALKVRGRAQPVPILRAARPAMAGDTLELRPDNVLVTSPSEVLGKYRLVELLGTGGMGKVWRAVDRFGNNVAIKVLHGGDVGNEGQIRRFRREAEIMARLSHRNICRVYEMNEFEGIHYLAMEYVEGLSLADILYSGAEGSTEGGVDLPALIRSIRAAKASTAGSGGEGPDGEPGEEPGAEADESVSSPAGAAGRRPQETRLLPVQQTLAIMLKVCEAVQFAHEHGVLHRDLKPGNILLRVDGEPLVADFGLAKLRGGDPEQSLSVSGHVVGTLENMPPEQAESSREVDERADVYALGTILYQMLTGRRHFVATGNLFADVQALQHHEPARLRAFQPKLDPDLEIITLKALRGNPAERYPSVEALRADLERFQRGEVISARPVSALELLKKLALRNRAATAILAGSLGLLLLTVALAMWGLSMQLAREQAARLEAEEARAEAERHKALAEEKQREAEAKEEAANEQRLRAEALLREKQIAEAAAEAERARREQALAETQEERERRLEAEMRAREKEEQLESARREMAMREAETADPPTAGGGLSDGHRVRSGDASARFAAERALAEAVAIVNFELSNLELLRNERTPEVVVARLARAMERVTGGLVAAPDMPEGWAWKGRLHLAALEFSQAEKSLARAEKLAEGAPEAVAGWAGAGRELIEAARAAGAGNVGLLLGVLAKSPFPPDAQIANILKFFRNRFSAPRQGGQAPTGRQAGAAEVALDLMLACGWDEAPEILGAESGSWTVRLPGSAPDLSALRGRPVSALEASEADALDWAVVAELGLERLDLSGSRLPFPPLASGLRGFSRLRELSIASTPTRVFDAARLMPQLERLNIADTEIADLAPLLWCRRLRHLDISGADRSGLRALLNLPLESLCLSPMLIRDKAGLQALRAHRTLKVLRTPYDPEDHPPSRFWKMLDSGEYDTGGD